MLAIKSVAFSCQTPVKHPSPCAASGIPPIFPSLQRWPLTLKGGFSCAYNAYAATTRPTHRAVCHASIEGHEESTSTSSTGSIMALIGLLAEKDKVLERLHAEKDKVHAEKDKVLERLLEEKDQNYKQKLQLTIDSTRLLHLENRVHVRGAVELAVERCQASSTNLTQPLPSVSATINAMAHDPAINSCIKTVSKRHNIKLSAVKARFSKLYDTLSKGVHESADDVVIHLGDTSLSQADVIAIVCILNKYAVTFRVMDLKGVDITRKYKCC